MEIAPHVAYIAAVILAGAAGLCLPGSNGLRKWGPASVISTCSFLLLVYVLGTFQRVAGADAIVTLMDWQMPFAGMTAGIDGLSARL